MAEYSQGVLHDDHSIQLDNSRSMNYYQLQLYLSRRAKPANQRRSKFKAQQLTAEPNQAPINISDTASDASMTVKLRSR